ncbi:MAG: hypothetical protein FWD65_04145 [Coriobacteriia bacterium]|nr:hypothetical protein [Coriobacteriia bacterium]
MSLSNWIELGVVGAILVIGLLLLFYFRHKFQSLDGFEGIVTEKNQSPRRADINLAEELELLEKTIKEKRKTDAF